MGGDEVATNARGGLAIAELSSWGRLRVRSRPNPLTGGICATCDDAQGRSSSCRGDVLHVSCMLIGAGFLQVKLLMRVVPPDMCSRSQTADSVQCVAGEHP